MVYYRQHDVHVVLLWYISSMWWTSLHIQKLDGPLLRSTTVGVLHRRDDRYSRCDVELGASASAVAAARWARNLVEWSTAFISSRYSATTRQLIQVLTVRGGRRVISTIAEWIAYSPVVPRRALDVGAFPLFPDDIGGRVTWPGPGCRRIRRRRTSLQNTHLFNCRYRNLYLGYYLAVSAVFRRRNCRKCYVFVLWKNKLRKTVCPPTELVLSGFQLFWFSNLVWPPGISQKLNIIISPF